jgi:intein/homing endonuclease
MLFHISPKEYWEKDRENANGKEKGMILYYYSKQIFYELISNGIISGNKTKNQISVPGWIKKNKKYIIACIRGLFDTDGSLHLYSKRPSLRIEFSNASLPLIKDFYDMCISLGIYPQPKVIKRKWKNTKNQKITYTYKVIITAKNQITKFLYIIQPKKWHFHSNEIIKKLNKIGLNIDDILLYKSKFSDLYNSKEIIKQLKS